jgi:hypothetical protein
MLLAVASNQKTCIRTKQALTLLYLARFLAMIMKESTFSQYTIEYCIGQELLFEHAKMVSAGYLLHTPLKMDLFSTRLAQFFIQRALRWLVAVLRTSLTFWGLILEDDVRQNPSSRRLSEKPLSPRS